MAAEPMPHELTDEELGRLAFDAYYASGDDEETVEDWTNVARAVRAALTPAVAPLAPGETVTIGSRIDLDEDDGRLFIQGAAWLDADDVMQLRDTCDRWLAAQNETQVVKTG